MAFNIYGRLSFEHVFTPSSSNGSDPVYSASILMPKGSPEVKKVEDEMMRVATEKWGAKGKDVLAKLVRENRVCLRDGSTKDYDGYDGMCLSARATLPDLLSLIRSANRSRKRTASSIPAATSMHVLKFGHKTTPRAAAALTASS